ncbi:MAG: carboxypeptidase regulatory-like domain-containing protein, partial [Deltaproteobacteria bacterium]|nr:carboxypeptidase regulatory-like domain-containing protein [Deltaproteobacteria bacterium]
SCPYAAIWWNAEKALPQKCTFCVHLLEEGADKPRGAQACPTGALEMICVEDSDMERIREERGLEVLMPGLKAEPRVYYLNLYRHEKCFIAGNVVLQDKDECAEGAKVTLSKGNKGIDAVETNNYGDFKLDNLEENSGRYDLLVEYPGYREKKLSVEVKESVNIGTIFL